MFSVCRIFILFQYFGGFLIVDGVTFLLTTSCTKKFTGKINSFFLFYSALDLSKCPQQQVVTCEEPDMVDILSENPDEGPVAMVEESLSGNDGEVQSEFLCSQ